MPLHTYNVSVHWIGSRGAGTTSYRAYGRGHLLRASGKPTIRGSSDPLFLGEADCWNPEELFVAALSSCHMLWYLHLCAQAGIVVTDYEDDARGEMSEDGENGGQFTRVELHPKVVLAAPPIVNGPWIFINRRMQDALWRDQCAAMLKFGRLSGFSGSRFIQGPSVAGRETAQRQPWPPLQITAASTRPFAPSGQGAPD